MTWDERAVAWGTDKASNGHGYMDHYERLLQRRRPKVERLLEIGVAGGRSLQLWHALFPAALIVGVDIVPECRLHQRRDIAVVIANAADAAKMHAVHVLYGPFDVVIDDGSHEPGEVLAAFECLYPLLAPNGVYIVEDLDPASEFVQALPARWGADILPAKDPASCLVVVERP